MSLINAHLGQIKVINHLRSQCYLIDKGSKGDCFVRCCSCYHFLCVIFKRLCNSMQFSISGEWNYNHSRCFQDIWSFLRHVDVVFRGVLLITTIWHPGKPNSVDIVTRRRRKICFDFCISLSSVSIDQRAFAKLLVFSVYDCWLNKVLLPVQHAQLI